MIRYPRLVDVFRTAKNRPQLSLLSEVYELIRSRFANDSPEEHALVYPFLGGGSLTI